MPAAVWISCKRIPLDLVLMDLNYTRDTTSGDEGLDLLSRIQAIDQTVPVVAMTAWASVDLAVEAMRRGVCDFVLKPWENSRLLQTLKNEIEKGRKKRSQLRRDREETYVRAARHSLCCAGIPEFLGLQIAASSVPARTLSGDYFDVLDLGGGRLAISIGDVIGKGVPAALLMSNLQATVRALASRKMQPDAALTAELNQKYLLLNTTAV